MASKKRRKVRTIIANPDDPLFGEASFQLYGILKPDSDQTADVERARRELRGLRGHRIRVTLLGEEREEGTEDFLRQTRQHEELTLDRYGDVFGRDGALLTMLKRQQKRHSTNSYYLQFIEIEDLDDDE